jgi:hypothetical protein
MRQRKGRLREFRGRVGGWQGRAFEIRLMQIFGGGGVEGKFERWAHYMAIQEAPRATPR